MGGKSYSYVNYESGYGKFNGTASKKGYTFAGGGFSVCRTPRDKYKFDLSQYDGLVFDVAS